MSCGCSSGSGYDGGIYGGVCDTDTPYPSVSHESVPSLIDNLVYALYGAITKDVTSGKVVWNIPCDPSNIPATINNIPRNDGEGLLCYIVRALNLTTPSGFVTVNGVQTLTNKTLSSPTITGSGAISGLFTGNLTGTATTAVNIAGGLAGSIPYQTGAGLTALLPQGTAGQVLSTNGSGGIGWITNSTTSSSTNNINGGTAGVVVYQTGVNTTGFTAAGTSGQVLLSNGTSAPTWSTNIAGNAGTATQLQTSRTLGISGDVTGTASFNGSANATIAGTIANNAVTAAKLGTNEQKQICKAWVNFNGTTATPSTIRSSYNVSSITKNGTGWYTVNFATAMADANYAALCSSDPNGVVGQSFQSILGTVTSQTASSITFSSVGDYPNSTTSDKPVVSVAIFGN